MLRAEGAQREAPPHIVAGLKAVDPTVELLYLGPRRWVLGAVRPNRFRRAKAENALAHLARTPVDNPSLQPEDRQRWQQSRWQRRRFAELALLGFAPIAEYAVNDPDWSIVLDFQERDFLYRFAADMEFDKVLDRAECGPREREAARLMLDAARTHGMDAWRYAMRKRRSYRTASIQGAA